ncbi:GM16178 [Drosophila sechellia]|uniref:GM16178 n=1 Tax=Drosophila sechellia TaxID=7238 RepID=B4IML8_DROSE|nr:GM16178 [Drosophila sechellia]
MASAGVRSIEYWTLLVAPARLLLLAAVCAVATPPPKDSFPPPPPETDAAALQAVRRHLCGRFGKCGTGAQESPEERKCDAFHRNNCNQKTLAAAVMNLLNGRPAEGECLSLYGSRMVTSLMAKWKTLSVEQIAVSITLALQLELTGVCGLNGSERAAPRTKGLFIRR